MHYSSSVPQMNTELQIIPVSLLKEYLLNAAGWNLTLKFDALQEAEISTDSFSFYTSVASVYSSKIEGEDIELDSFVKHKKFGVSFLPDYTKKIDDLYDAYSLAKTHPLQPENMKNVHTILSKHFIGKNEQGIIRNKIMYVITPDGKIEYVAASPFMVKGEMEKLFRDVKLLLKQQLSIEEVFYFAAMIHLVFVKIHPFTDGNGRTARLLEKWFLAEKLGEKAWFLQSEKYYYEHHQLYYTNLRALGLEYEELNYNNSLPFLYMLPNSF